MSHEQLHERTDSERIENRPDAERPAEQPTGEYHRQLDSGAGQANRPSGPGHQTGHQSVSWPRAHPGTDVQRGCERVEHDARHHGNGPDRESVEMRQHRGRRVHGNGDHHDVAHGTQARTLPQRDPHQQYGHSGDRGDGSETQRQVTFETLVQDVPRVDAQSTRDHRRHRRPVQPQPHVEGSQPRGKPATGDDTTW
ncbi:hypothetical protein NY08_1546 [Rhodococcus sp. B7740]|nr:hypothetical protein NY08_1546 [Rhodococcus sp. B7740]